MVGFLVYGFAANRAERSGKTLHLVVIGSLLSALVVALIIVWPPAVATPLWFAYAVVGSGGVLAYVVGLAAAWPFPNSRYLVPILPGLIAGILVALNRAASFRGFGIAAYALKLLFIAMFVLVNAAMWATDVWIARSGDADTYYARYEAGLHWNLMAVADELADSEGSIAVSERYENLNERWDYQHAERVVAYIADRPSTPVPGPLTGWSVKYLQQWSRDNDGAWDVHQIPTVPGRVWHFRLTPDEHAAVTQRERPGPREWQFELYRMQNFAGPDEPPRTKPTAPPPRAAPSRPPLP